MKKVPEQLVLDVEGSLSSVLAPDPDSRQQSDCRWNSDHRVAPAGQGYKRDIQNSRSFGVFMSGWLFAFCIHLCALKISDFIHYWRPLIITQATKRKYVFSLVATPLSDAAVPLLGSSLFCKWDQGLYLKSGAPLESLGRAPHRAGRGGMRVTSPNKLSTMMTSSWLGLPPDH